MKETQPEKEDEEYWSDYNTESSHFQHNELLQIVSHYSLDHTDKQAYLLYLFSYRRGIYLRATQYCLSLTMY